MNPSKKPSRDQSSLGDALFGTRLGEARLQTEPKTGADLFVVDNSDAEWKVKKYLQDWADIATSFDIATGFFEIGALLTLDGSWQKLDSLRILMGDEVSSRTKQALLDGIACASRILDSSLEAEKEGNDFLKGVPAIVDAIRNKKIQCKIYTKNKFHAKAYITHAKQAVVGSSALVGSSNLTLPGLTTNVELNVQLRREVDVLQRWFEEYWQRADDVSEELLKVIERHIKEYTPFEVYAKSLQEFFRGHELTVGEWEKTQSSVYPVLDQYQKEGYQALVKIANQYGGAFMCDGVGLGKTLIGLMLIERLIMHDRKRVLLLVTKAAGKPVWERHLKRYLPHLCGGDFSSLAVYNHTDLLRGGDYPEKFERIRSLADVVVIDEGHHFRNPGLKDKTSYWKLDDICQGKRVVFLTATPINNSLRDLQHMIELFSHRDSTYFKAAPLGIHSLPGHFRKLEKDLEEIINGRSTDGDGETDTNQVEAQKVLLNDALFRALVVQRSRGYVKKSQTQQEDKALFPVREPPHVAHYDLKKVYGHLLDIIEKAFQKDKPLFSLAMYYPLAYSRKALEGSKEEVAFRINRQKQLVRLIRILFLKRFESSAMAFEASCHDLLLKMLAFVAKHARTDEDKANLERWKAIHADLVRSVTAKRQGLFDEEPDEDNEDILPADLLVDTKELPADEYYVDRIVKETYLDMDQIVVFLTELAMFKPANDDKLNGLVKLLKTDPVLSRHKVLIFSEFMTTARYLKQELTRAGITGLDEVDSATGSDRGEVISRFSPYYNDLISAKLREDGLAETRVLISTDVLSEGLNLQDATRLINYDLHWNPVRLMQRIGRVDRRLTQEVEDRIIADHPEQKPIRGTAAYWNFLPPDELNGLLHLYEKVSGKTLKISKTLGIEGKKLLRPEDEYEALKDFNHDYEGETSLLEDMHLEYQKLLRDHPELEARLNELPGKVFSGKQHPTPAAQAVFFCYSLPAPQPQDPSAPQGAPPQWTFEAGLTRWYLYRLADGEIVEEPSDIIGLIRSQPDTPRHRALPDATLSEIRAKVDQHIKDKYLKKVQAPAGVKPKLRVWMELS